MAEPRDSTTVLEDVPDIIQNIYMKRFDPQYIGRHGKSLNRVFKPDAMETTGSGKTMQTEIAPGDNARASTDALGAFAAPDHLEAAAVTVRFSRTNPTASDFTRISASCQTDDIDVQEAGKGSQIDFVKRMYSQVVDSYDERLAQLRECGRNGVLALVNGTTGSNAAATSTTWYAITGSATNTNGLRCNVDTGSIANFRRGARIDFINPSTGAIRAGNCRVNDVNYANGQIGVTYTSSTSYPPWTSSGDLANVTDNDYIVRSGEYNQGLFSLGAWLSRPTVGESFLGGVDRTALAYRWMLTNCTREGETPAQITASMFDDLAIMMGYLDDTDDIGPILSAHPTVIQTMRRQIGEDSIIQVPYGDSRLERFGNFGSTGLNYQHPVFGVVKLHSDPLHPADHVRLLSMGTWISMYYGWKGLRPLTEGGTHWYRMNEAAPNTGKGVMLKCDWYAFHCDFCTQPIKNGTIQAITA